MKIIGIVPTSNYMLTDDTFKDHYRYGNNYINKIIENNAIPYLIPLHNNKLIPETLKKLDGVIFPGGDRVTEYSLELMDYCYKNRIPVLGICLGMQTIAMYSVNIYKPKRIIKKIEGHWPYPIKRNNNTKLAHKDYIENNSIMYDIFNCNEIKVNSLHHNTITEVGPNFKGSIKSEDGLIEGIEYINKDRFIIGVQFHPEILPEFNNIFKYFIDNC